MSWTLEKRILAPGGRAMNRHAIAKSLSILVSVTGAIVMIGWFLDIDALKSILPVWVTMKFTTALSFTLSGITLFFIAQMIQGKRALAQVIIPITTSTILIIMLTLLTSVFLGIRTGIEDLFVAEVADAIQTTTPGRPSVGTMLCFILVEASGFLAIFAPATLGGKLPTLGWSVVVLGGLAVIGYLVDVPMLYYTISEFSTAMAFHTALLFIALGLGLVLASISRHDFGTSLT